MTLHGILDVSFWQAVVITLAMTHLTIAAVTIFLHRAQAHRALDLHPAVAHVFRFWLWLTTGMVTKEWVAVHRLHHAKCETALDPHSPQVLGLRRVLTQGAEVYAAAAADSRTLERYGHATPDDWLERRLYTPWRWQGLALMLGLDLLLFGLYGPVIWAVQMLWVPVTAAGIINGVGHYWGYRNFETADASTNIVPWGLIIGGEELHNNHHAFPSSARLSSQWWEFDLSWLYIRALSALGLARIKRVAPRLTIIRGKTLVDMDTLSAVVTSHLHVFARYTKEVLAPVSRAELCRDAGHCRRLIRQSRRLLEREGNRLDAAARVNLERLLAQNQTLATVYQFRERLQAIWGRGAASQEVLLGNLQDWCRQAEATGIQALERFARNLKGFSLTPMGTV
ncbi:fatty acid desaturase [Candidatus Thiodictyon syntrophicum]|jgi:stearoyl-CoA desaturase (delta-9 desaturase)|uniref:Acyl-CoA desaturase n=1 Tax=Candidatus Thiodictyon syntrophicum TaxID=1166950 RepID=A0A2K8UCT8_9GAMM|nr:fatty acid desaturase [Candidatus Thiodictyon syntrophicum]AUB83408.1 acyl-CoA desaturase [Candidatus Thiodictyon syntrophicum]